MSISRTIAVVAVAAATATASTVAVASVATPHSTANRTVASAAYAPHAVPSRWKSRVIGSFGSAGKVTGTFVPLRSFVRNRHTVVQGNLTTTLTRGNGAVVGRTFRHNVAIPIDAPGARGVTRAAAAPRAASCSVLNLVLGPLDLNLLGLAVHLDRVVLTITALPGAGALLGNLLCAVAGLLNGPLPSLTSLLNLSSLLNRILGLVS